MTGIWDEIKSYCRWFGFSQRIYTTLKEKVKEILENYVQNLIQLSGSERLQRMLWCKWKKVSRDKAVILAGNILRHQFDVLNQ